MIPDLQETMTILRAHKVSVGHQPAEAGGLLSLLRDEPGGRKKNYRRLRRGMTGAG